MTADRAEILDLASKLAAFWGREKVTAALKTWGPTYAAGNLRRALDLEAALEAAGERLASSPRFRGGRAAWFVDNARLQGVPAAELARLVDAELAQDARPDIFAQGELAARRWAPCAPVSLWSWALGPWQEVEVFASDRRKPSYVVTVTWGRARRCTCEDFTTRSAARLAQGKRPDCKHFAVAESAASFWAEVWAKLGDGLDPAALVASFVALRGTDAERMDAFLHNDRDNAAPTPQGAP